MNQKAIIDGPLHGYGAYTVGPVGTYPATSYLSSQGQQGDPFPYNPTKAKQLLTSHGWNVVPNGVTTCPNPQPVRARHRQGPPARVQPALRDRDQLDRAGNDPAAVERLAGRHQAQPRAQAVQPGDRHRSAQLRGREDLLQLGHGELGRRLVVLPDYYPSGETLFLSGSGANSGGYSNAENDSLIDQTLTSTSPSALNNWQNYLSTQVPFIWQPNGAYEMTEVTNGLRGVLPQDTTANINPEDWYFTK